MRATRKKAVTTQYELGKLIGCAQSQVWQFEKGYAVPRGVVANRLFRWLVENGAQGAGQ